VQQVSAELSEARVIIASFRAENEALAQNFETCKATLLDTRAKYQRAASELLEATERQVATDARHEAFREEVRALLAGVLRAASRRRPVDTFRTQKQTLS
jgi:hypothetical protein